MSGRVEGRAKSGAASPTAVAVGNRGNPDSRGYWNEETNVAPCRSGTKLEQESSPIRLLLVEGTRRGRHGGWGGLGVSDDGPGEMICPALVSKAP